MHERHPIELERGFIARTMPLMEFSDALTGSIADLQTSLVVTGVQRNGKTTAMEYVKERLMSGGASAFFNAMTLAVDPKKRASKDLEAAFWQTFLLRARENARLSFESNFSAFLTAIRTACDRLGTTSVVICLDDAQRLTPPLFGYLKNLHEQLLAEGYQPFFLLIAQPDMPLRMHQLQVDTMHEYIDRFLTNDFRFRGNRAEDVKMFLRHYDTATWPSGSAITFTQHHAPVLWRAGWRLEMEAEPLWAAFETLASSLNLNPATLEVGTKFLVAACKASLVALRNGKVKLLTHLTWQSAAERSGYYKTRLLANDPEELARLALRDLLQREVEAIDRARDRKRKSGSPAYPDRFTRPES